MFRLFEIIGNRFLKFVEEGGKLFIIFFKTLLWTFRPPFNFKNILNQIEEVGVNSIPVIMITGAFTGMVLSLQSHTGFKRFGAETFVGTVVADIIGIIGGYMVSVYVLGSNPTIYERRTWDFLELNDVYSGLLKATVFGMIIAIVSCYQGFNTEGGASGVGKATTKAVVLSSLLILVANYFITALM